MKCRPTRQNTACSIISVTYTELTSLLFDTDSLTPIDQTIYDVFQVTAGFSKNSCSLWTNPKTSITNDYADMLHTAAKYRLPRALQYFIHVLNIAISVRKSTELATSYKFSV